MQHNVLKPTFICLVFSLMFYLHKFLDFWVKHLPGVRTSEAAGHYGGRTEETDQPNQTGTIINEYPEQAINSVRHTTIFKIFFSFSCLLFRLPPGDWTWTREDGFRADCQTQWGDYSTEDRAEGESGGCPPGWTAAGTGILCVYVDIFSHSMLQNIACIFFFSFFFFSLIKYFILKGILSVTVNFTP